MNRAKSREYTLEFKRKSRRTLHFSAAHVREMDRDGDDSPILARTQDPLQ